MHMNVWFRQRGPFFHCRVFTAKLQHLTHGKNGDLVFSEVEWPEVRAALESIATVQAEEEDHAAE